MRKQADLDHERVRSLARSERDHGCREASEGGRRIAYALASRFQHGDETVWPSLLGLAAIGATSYMRSVLKENALRVRRNKQVVTISGSYALPESVVINGTSTVQIETESDDTSRRNLYVQFDFMSWAQFFMVLDLLRGRRGALDATVTTFDEIAKLEKQYPTLTVGEAITTAGLDLSSRYIDLDALQAVI
jgi:hypothetical protein